MFVLRTPVNYDYHCSLLSGPFSETDSVTYGLNHHSVLNKFKHFHVCNNQLPQDITGRRYSLYTETYATELCVCQALFYH